MSNCLFIEIHKRQLKHEVKKRRRRKFSSHTGWGGVCLCLRHFGLFFGLSTCWFTNETALVVSSLRTNYANAKHNLKSTVRLSVCVFHQAYLEWLLSILTGFYFRYPPFAWLSFFSFLSKKGGGGGGFFFGNWWQKASPSPGIEPIDNKHSSVALVT